MSERHVYYYNNNNYNNNNDYYYYNSDVSLVDVQVDVGRW